MGISAGSSLFNFRHVMDTYHLLQSKMTALLTLLYSEFQRRETAKNSSPRRLKGDMYTLSMLQWEIMEATRCDVIPRKCGNKQSAKACINKRRSRFGTLTQIKRGDRLSHGDTIYTIKCTRRSFWGCSITDSVVDGSAGRLERGNACCCKTGVSISCIPDTKRIGQRREVRGERREERGER